ncbi:MAG: AIR synthase [Lachnospiraceae bacterium]|nr:AIR synthase [Lachnospiraceae bacterium]
MEIGKIPADVLEKIVLKPLTENNIRKDVVIRPATGEDCAAIDMEDKLCVVSSDPITGADSDAGYLAVYINCNDIASAGAEPVGILLTVLLPPGTEEKLLMELSEGAKRAADELGIEILGGHTEVTAAVNKPVISGTAIGKTRKDSFVSTSGAKTGQDIIITKWAGLEGTAVIAADNETYLRENLGNEVIDAAIELKGYISVVKEALIAASMGATCMHDATEGGVLGAIWEICVCSGKGCEVDGSLIPIREETKAIADLAGIDPLKLISGGTLILTAFNGEKIVKRLEEENISAKIIGKIKDGKAMIKRNGVCTEMEAPVSDELYKVRFDKKGEMK